MAKTMESGHKMVWVKGAGYQYEHRVKAGLKPGDKRIVHHRDGNPGSNDSSNLQVVASKKQHNKIDPKIQKGKK